jgi:hypothetical protein
MEYLIKLWEEANLRVWMQEKGFKLDESVFDESKTEGSKIESRLAELTSEADKSYCHGNIMLLLKAEYNRDEKDPCKHLINQISRL